MRRCVESRMGLGVRWDRPTGGQLLRRLLAAQGLSLHAQQPAVVLFWVDAVFKVVACVGGVCVSFFAQLVERAALEVGCLLFPCPRPFLRSLLFLCFAASRANSGVRNGQLLRHLQGKRDQRMTPPHLFLNAGGASNCCASDFTAPGVLAPPRHHVHLFFCACT